MIKPTMKILRGLHVMAFTASIIFLVSCSDDDPVKEDTPELITQVTLTFTPDEGDAVVVTATDPDGIGVKNIEADHEIVLDASRSYTLTLKLINSLAEVTSPEYNITDEVSAESAEHMFFFAWTTDLFSSPAGNGNIDSRSDAVNYNDADPNSLPLGLSTGWTTATAAVNGTFRILLKHQPGIKSATSSASEGESDLDVTFDLKVE